MTNYFDLTKGDIDGISIHESASRLMCYIADNETMLIIYKGFILSDMPQVQTLCEVDFHPSGQSGKFVPRLVFKKIKKPTGEIKESAKDQIRISFGGSEDGYAEFWKMISFLNKFKDLVDTGNFERTFKVVDSDSFILQFKDKEQSDKATELSRILNEGNLDQETIRIALLSNRAKTVEQFSDLLHRELFTEYREQFPKQITEQGEEAVWHHFLKNNLWIIGLGIDIKFIRDLISEVNVGMVNTQGSGSPTVDLMGITDYTLLVELKKASTKIFSQEKKKTGRANTWTFTSDFIDGVSQCLGQKTDWETHHLSKQIPGDGGILIDQNETRTVDPRVIFVIGNRMKEFPEDLLNVENICKRDTFERFRRNNRNVDIVTYDELFEKAYYIVHGKKPVDLKQLAAVKIVAEADLPF